MSFKKSGEFAAASACTMGKQARKELCMSIRKRSLPRGWYPHTETQCREQIRLFLNDFALPEGSWLGGVAPHAGWDFSGRGAARVFGAIASGTKPDCVVVYGGHLSGHDHPIVYTESAWETPLGPLSTESTIVNELLSSRVVQPVPYGFADNTVEVLVPFVRFFFPESSLVAVHSPASERAISLGMALATMLASHTLSAVFIGSADLTHYGPNYGFAPKGTGASAVKWVKEENDRSLIEKALQMDAAGVLQDARSRHNTCSPGPIASVIASALELGVTQGRLVEYYTSYDVMPSSSFVGYAGIVY
ncbi:MAG: AmmeMemoRadiSam system protein B [Desulfomonilaceae bacterium]